jgi:hypothetical protein
LNTWQTIRAKLPFAKSKPAPFAPVMQDKYNRTAANAKAALLGYGKPTASSAWFEESLTGDKFAGGFGATKVFTPDYWTLRQRSEQLFHENLYARGLIRRLVTNEINTGLTL